MRIVWMSEMDTYKLLAKTRRPVSNNVEEHTKKKEEKRRKFSISRKYVHQATNIYRNNFSLRTASLRRRVIKLFIKFDCSRAKSRWEFSFLIKYFILMCEKSWREMRWKMFVNFLCFSLPTWWRRRRKLICHNYLLLFFATIADVCVK